MLTELAAHIARWRTWIVNAIAALLVVLPDVMNAFSGYDWSAVIPQKYMWIVTLAVIVLNIWMRPRPAVLPSDKEAKK